MNSVYIDSAVPSSPIYLAPNNASSVIIGNANCTTTLVGPLNIGTTTANTVNIGKEGASTNLFGFTNLGLVTSGTKTSYIEVGTGGGNAVIDFHSSGLFDTDNDSRIMSQGGTSTGTQGSLQLYAKTITLNSETSNIGVTSSSNSYIGNGTSNSNGIGTGVCSINKLQVGNTTFGNGVANGTAVRCIIYGVNIGASTTSGTVIIPGAPIGAGNPMIFASINITTTTNPYFINVNTTGTNTFVYYKSFHNGSAFAAASVESFNYMAIWF